MLRQSIGTAEFKRKMFTSFTILNPIMPGGGGGGLRDPDDQIYSCHSEPSYSMMPKLRDFWFLSLRHALTKF